MKIYCFFPYAVYSGYKKTHSGILKKISSQVNSFSMICDDIERCDLDYHINSPLAYLTSWCNNFTKIKRILNNARETDVVYIRNVYPYLTYAILIKKRHKPTIILEIHGIENDQYKIFNPQNLFINIQSLSLNIFNTMFGKHIKSNVDGIVCVTNEISDYNKKLTRHIIPILTLGNGIDISLYITRSTPEYNNELHVLIVANTHPWHGIDRFIRGLHAYTGDITIILHIVGDGPELSNLKSLTTDLNLEDRVIFHGFKSGTELDAMFDQCHIALDALAAFRKNLNELSTLKAREYCARGIPFLMASKDADFPESWDYIQMVPATEDPIDMELVIAFADRVLADHDHPQKMHEYAKDHLDWLAKMKVMKEFLETL